MRYTNIQVNIWRKLPTKAYYYFFYRLCLILILSSCSAQKRCERHLTKAKQLGCYTTDTIERIDTIKGFSIDTLFISDSLTIIDTFTLVKDNIITKTIVNWKTKTIGQNLSKTDTIIKTKQVTNTVFKAVEKIPWSYKIALGVLTLIILGLVFRKK